MATGTTFTAGLACMLILASPALGDETNDAEVRRLQGRYERTVKNEAGTEFRVVKEVVGSQTTVTTYDDVGNVVEAATSTFKTEKRGEIRVWTYFNKLVTAGPAKGRQQLESRSYIYRSDDNNFAEVWGLLESDPTPPRMFVWKRLK